MIDKCYPEGRRKGKFCEGGEKISRPDETRVLRSVRQKLSAKKIFVKTDWRTRRPLRLKNAVIALGRRKKKGDYELKKPGGGTINHI